jgi:hypothetical protein
MNQYYDDIEEKEEPFMISEEEQQLREERVEKVRKAIHDWKKSRLNMLTKDNQDTLVLNTFRNELVQLYYLLRDVMDGDEPTKELKGHVVWKDIEMFFPLQDGIERIDLTHRLHRDLIEFPFTFNTKLVNAFLKKNSLQEAEILPNE